jgi:hypothetical protein
LLNSPKDIKRAGNKYPQIVKLIDTDTSKNIDQVINLNDRLVVKVKDILSTIQEISKNRERLAIKTHNMSVDDIKRKSHLVVTLNLY